ncbi:MAG: PadR family transcriptional regulator [Polyangiaceae bacterium]
MEPFVLLELARGPAHGYQLAQAIAALGFRRIADDASVLYKLLRALEEEGYAVSSWETVESGPPRRMYELTTKGEAYLCSRADDVVRQRKRLDIFIEGFRRVKRKLAHGVRESPRRSGSATGKETSHE